jgi:hypothetical protein
MARVIYSSLLGAIFGGLILAAVAGLGVDALARILSTED